MSASTDVSPIAPDLEEPNSFPDDCLPPEGEYSSRDELVSAINVWAATRGYAFITRKSTTKTSGRKIVTYACDRSWQPKTSANKDRARKTTTRGTGCPFSVLAKESLDKTTWYLQHRPNKECSKHNHPPSSHPSAHPVHRKLDANGKASLAELVSAGISPRDIQTYLRQQDGGSLATRQDIYNYIAKLKDDLHEGQSSIHALINQLDREGFWSRLRVDENQRVTAILFAHPGSLQYLQAYSDLLLLDCTYKTNKYQMPLLDMIGVDACRRSFCIAFAFLSGEQEEDYVWALERLQSLYEMTGARLPSVVLSDRCLACLNAIDRVLPSAQSLLCLWHANKAVLAHCLPIFSLQEKLAAGAASNAAGPMKRGSKPDGWADFYNFWHSIMQSPTEAIFNERVAAFEQKYLPDHSEEVAYVKKTWLEPYKEKLVKAWVDQHMHFGNAVTSRVEGIHALLKSYLKTSNFDLFDVWRTIKHAVENQLSELQSLQARQQTRKPTEHLGAGLFSALHGWISHEAMKKVEEQRKLLDKKDPFSSPLCTGTFTRSHGLPCVHTIKALQERNQVLQMRDFHRQWHLKRSGTHPQPILEPNRVKTGTMNTKIAQSSTQREPSAFERLGKPAPPKCSRCHIVGHSRTSKSCPLRQKEVLLESSASHLAEPLATSTQMLAGWSQEAENALASQSRIPYSSIDQRIDVEEAQCQDTIVGGSTSPQPSRASEEPELPMPSQSTPLPSSSLPKSREAQVLPYYAREAVYQRYVAARAAWYKSQPAGSLKTNQAYRGAMGLPQRYSKETFAWCQDYKQMGRFCYLPQGGRREWTREEMMAYIDWDYEEARRTDAQVQRQLENNNKEKSRRGMADIFREAEEDTRVQEARYSIV